MKMQDAAHHLEYSQSTGEIRTGLIAGHTFDRKIVRYKAVNGLAIFEGDIVLGTVEEMEATMESAAVAALVSGSHPARGIGVNPVPGSARWPFGIIPYQIVTSLPDQARVTDAINEWETNTVIRFVLRTASNASQYPNFVSFEPAAGCSSPTGMKSGKQVISLDDDCTTGNVMHEIGHTVGLWHEQSRADRNSFVTYVSANVIPGKEDNFDQHITDGDDIGPYDYGSIMHYPADAFSKNGKPTLITPNGEAIGQRNGLSLGDIAAVRNMYPGSTDAALAAASTGNRRIWIFSKGLDLRVYYNTARAGHPFSKWREESGGAISTLTSPAAAANGDFLHLFVKGIDERIYTHVPVLDSNWTEVPGSFTDVAPATASLGNRIYLFMKGYDNRIYVNSRSREGGSWAGWTEVQGGGTTNRALGVASLSNRIYVFAKGNDDLIYVNSAVDGKPFDGWSAVPGGYTDVAPAAASLGNRIYLFMKGFNNRIYVNSAVKGQPFGGWKLVEGNGTTDAPLAATAFNNRLYVFAKGIINNRIYFNSAADSQPFGGWQEVQW